MSTASEKSNLARIRENQRRSRARRREYVQELEQRLRLVEIQGIEASAEIQVVARKVAEENKKLRVLLNKKGVENDTIENFLVSGMATQSPRGSGGSRALASSASSSCCPVGGVGGSASSSSSRNNDVQELEQLLIPRRPSWCDLPSSASDMIGGGGGDDRGAVTDNNNNNNILIRSTRSGELPLPLSPVGGSSTLALYDSTNFSDHSSSRNSLPDDSGFAQLSVSEHHNHSHTQRTLSPTISLARSSVTTTPTEVDHHRHHHHHQPRYYNTAYSLADTNPTSPQELGYSYGLEPLHSPYQQHHHHQHHAHHHHHSGISSLSSVQGYSPSRDDSLSSAHSPISSTTANSCTMAGNVSSNPWY